MAIVVMIFSIVCAVIAWLRSRDRAGCDSHVRAVRVHLVTVRHEQDIGASRAQARGVGFRRARITVEVLVRPELQWVHKN